MQYGSNCRKPRMLTIYSFCYIFLFIESTVKFMVNCNNGKF